jgi:N utilization substance protein B
MLRKRKTRELAMQVMFLWDSNGEQDAELARRITDEGTDDQTIRQSALEMAQGTWEQRASIDQQVERLAPQWPPRRQPGVDRNLIRLAVWELTNAQTPPKVVLDEAIELAKKFSTEQSPAFINGVLDAVLREHLALTATQAPTEKGIEDADEMSEIRMTNDESKPE